MSPVARIRLGWGYLLGCMVDWGRLDMKVRNFTLCADAEKRARGLSMQDRQLTTSPSLVSRFFMDLEQVLGARVQLSVFRNSCQGNPLFIDGTGTGIIGSVLSHSAGMPK